MVEHHEQQEDDVEAGLLYNVGVENPKPGGEGGNTKRKTWSGHPVGQQTPLGHQADPTRGHLPCWGGGATTKQVPGISKARSHWEPGVAPVGAPGACPIDQTPQKISPKHDSEFRG